MLMVVGLPVQGLVASAAANSELKAILPPFTDSILECVSMDTTSLLSESFLLSGLTCFMVANFSC